MGAGSSKGGPKITPHDRAVLDLKLQRDRIKQYQKKLVVIQEREHELARQALARGDKARALTALRKRKYQESLITKTDSQLETLEGLVSSIEFSQIQQSVMLGLQQGNTVLKEIHAEMSIESVDKLMEQTAEAQAYQREIDDMLVSRMTLEEEEDVQLEIAALEREALGLPALTPQEPAQVSLPSAPTDEPVSLPPVTAQPAKAQQNTARTAEEPLAA